VALSLRAHAPNLSIALVEQSGYSSVRAGEVLPGPARKLLESLGVWEAFEREAWRPVYSVAAAWGSPVLRENHFIYMLPGHGWHLDRAKFDRFLSQQAQARGVTLLSGTGVQAVARTEGGFRLALSDGTPFSAAFVVDATGRYALVARSLGASVVSLDPLIGFSRLFSETHDSDPRTLIEAVPDGWWYTATLTGNLRVATFMTDPDIARAQRVDRESGWREALSRTRFIADLVPRCAAVAEVVRPAGSAYLQDPCGEGWIAAGDAACAHDPLSGQGITRALRSGILASFAIHDVLYKGSPEGLERYRGFLRQGWRGYLSARHRFYAEENRWSERAFWHRRSLLE
jgi:flavin-dependent dehydrogenase